MFLQTGVSFKYLQSITHEAYSPLARDFFYFKISKLGGFPSARLLVNERQQTRLF